MGDIDFDELDRAVSSALQGNSSQESAADTKVAQSNSLSQDGVQDVSVKKTLVQRRTNGRFMDVVHPSSDMKLQSKPKVSRNALSITPPQEDVQEESEALPQFIPDSKDTSDLEQADTESHGLHTFPDPLDFHSFGSTDSASDNEPDEVSKVEDVRGNKDEFIEESGEMLNHDDRLELDQVAGELSELDGLLRDDREMPPLDTPFVNDLSVEKRPLGAFSIDTDNTEGSAKDETDPVNLDYHMSSAMDDELSIVKTDEESTVFREADAQIPPEIEVIPEEFHEDIMAVEAREVHVAPSLPTSENSAPSVATSEASPTANAPSSVGSIQQQYVEKAPATQLEPTTPVFDTNDYHQPIKHAEKKKSGWIVVVMIIVFILLGVGAGIAIHFFDPFGLIQ